MLSGGWRRESRDGIAALICELPGARAVFSTRQGGISRSPYASLNLGWSSGDDRGAVLLNTQRLVAAWGSGYRRGRFLHQLHSDRVVHVDGGGPDGLQQAGSGDALVSSRPDTLLVTFHADCCAVFVVDPARGAFGLAHAGWRGTARQVTAAVVGHLQRLFGSKPAELAAAVGPCICPACYQVDGRVVAALDRLPYRDRVLTVSGSGWRLDLALAQQQALVRAGVDPARVEVAACCTRCNPTDFFSHRGQGPATGRMAALLGLVS